MEFIKVDTNARIGGQDAGSLIRRWRDEYFERNQSTAPYFGADQCHLVISDNTPAVVGFAEYDSGRVSVVFHREDYNAKDILDCAVEYFGRHSTAWGVYDAQMISR